MNGRRLATMKPIFTGERARLAVAAFIAIQLALPASAYVERLGSEGWWPATESRMFSWQMYSAASRTVCDNLVTC